MTLEKALAAYLMLRTEVERIEAAAKAETAKLKRADARLGDVGNSESARRRSRNSESERCRHSVLVYAP